MTPYVSSVVVVALLSAAVVVVARSTIAEVRVVHLSVQGGQLPEEQRVIRVQQGDDVTLEWASDRAVTIHLHGYDIERTILPGQVTTMRFVGRATGRFPLEIHDSQRKTAAPLAYLEVHPR